MHGRSVELSEHYKYYEHYESATKRIKRGGCRIKILR